MTLTEREKASVQMFLLLSGVVEQSDPNVKIKISASICSTLAAVLRRSLAEAGVMCVLCQKHLPLENELFCSGCAAEFRLQILEREYFISDLRAMIDE